MSRKDLIDIYGFKELPHRTITNSLVLDLGRNRQLSISCFGTPNEMMTLAEIDPNDSTVITDLVVLWNHDYDGYLTKGKIELLMSFFSIK